ncbi:hypothetical protein ACKGJN_01125 [Gillisia sp. Q332]|uniref:hypothetical protein n=1 Tax=Gillisia xinjiangensis TaxID=3384765 RepID=UPI00391DCAC1
MRNTLAALVIVLILISCSKDGNQTSDPEKYIPENVNFVLQSANLSKFISEVDSTSFFRKNSFLFEGPAFEHLKNLNKISESKTALVCFVKNEQGEYEYLLISKNQPEIKTDSIKNRSLETLTFDSFEIRKIGTEEFTTYTAKQDAVLLASNSLELLKNTIAKAGKDIIRSESFKIAWTAADKKSTSLFINHSNLEGFFTRLVPDSPVPLKNLGDWSVLDLEIEGQDLLINGIISSNENSPKTLDIFQEVEVQKNEIAQITPTSAQGFSSFTYSRMEKLHRNLNKFRKDSLELSPNHLLNFTKEAGLIYSEENVLVLTTTDPELAKGSIPGGEQAAEFRGISIMKNPEPDEFSKILAPLMTEENLKFYALVEHFVIFSGSVKTLENIITNFQNNTTLEQQEYYQKAVSNLAGSSSLLFVANTINLKNSLKSTVSDEFKTQLESLYFAAYPIIALQFVQEKNFAHIHGVLKASINKPSLGIREIGSIKLNSTIGNLPVLVENHTNKQSEILVQDIENVLHLYSSAGDLKWKKQMNIRIAGEIHQVDLFKNGNLQLAFNTPNAFHVLDRNGKPVKPFPLEFKDEISVPVSIFDYDNNRNYRFVITQKNNFLMYDRKGKSVSGFDFEKTTSEITQSPKHFRLKNKDYIVFPESNGKLNINSRQGKSRIKVKEKIDFSENEWYQNKGKFVSVNSANNLVFVDVKGNVEEKKVAFNVNLQLAATENTLVTLSENVLVINDTEINLDYGLYTQPKIFEFGSKTYIAVTDTQAQRIFVFDKNAALLPGFPVYGNSAIDMHLENGGNVVLTVKGEEDTILVYTRI